MTDTTTARPKRPAHRDDGPPVRGIGHLRHPAVSGGLIGVIGGGAFLFGGIAGLPAEHRATLRGIAISLISFTLVVVLLRRRMLPTVPTPARGALRVYGIAVVAMLAFLPVTRLVALALDAPTAQIALVAAVVGGHFLPFARAFQAPVFWWIGGAMAALGLAGAALAALGDPVAGPAGAAAAGVAMLVIVAAQGLLASPRQD
ncbi:hypothetical protein SAMN04487849_11330 [Micrococcus luteus]|uniref:Uncharacterized protein n=1 Tax=Micrococcus luteus TaxID=1270 RepID=A0ABD7M9W7_MICLU|nr:MULTISPECIES: hypothetical protein [Micrococcus]MCV7567039.1 hypothetical protein [Micrococcus luteus]MCV7612706.1 hypothetical protein [Micrococcus luteus]MCV7664200.1 hypothetical protein [Micrococcus luteus]MCV7694287.1 hypothetical protein [Micrococcus luteus]TWH37264.1 hypothetical protein L597_002600000090 [Micrococcus luteus J28]